MKMALLFLNFVPPVGDQKVKTGFSVYFLEGNKQQSYMYDFFLFYCVALSSLIKKTWPANGKKNEKGTQKKTGFLCHKWKFGEKLDLFGAPPWTCKKSKKGELSIVAHDTAITSCMIDDHHYIWEQQLQ